MPAKAKLTTRNTATTTVTSDNLAKGTELSFNEADSNFINLRDQTFGLVGDDSAGVDVQSGQTITVTGTGGITVAVANDTVTIDGSGITPGSSIGDLSVIGSTILAPSNADLTLDTSGTGEIRILPNKITLGPQPGVGVGNAILTTPASSSKDLELHTNNGTNTGIIKIQADANQNILITPNGAGVTAITNPSLSGTVNIKGIYWPASDGTNQQVLTTNGAGTLSWRSISAGVDIVLTDFAFGVCVDSSGYAVNKTSNDTTILTSAAVQSAVATGKTGTTSIPTFTASTIASVNRFATGMYRFVLDNNITVSSIQQFSGGQTLTFFVHQDSVGGRTITWTDTIKWLGGVSTLSTGANKIDKIVLTNNGYNIFGELTKDYS